jgi:hypothetical protein
MTCEHSLVLRSALSLRVSAQVRNPATAELWETPAAPSMIDSHTYPDSPPAPTEVVRVTSLQPAACDFVGYRRWDGYAKHHENHLVN